MRSRFLILVILGVSLVFGALIYRQLNFARKIDHSKFVQKKLRILTYASFAGPAGPGGPLAAQFKKLCNCDLEVQIAGDAGLILERLKLLSESSFFDLVIGLDQNALIKAKELQWQPLRVNEADWNSAVKPYLQSEFVPFDWSYLTFIYRDGEIAPPQTLSDLAKPEYVEKIAIQDPRSSAPGLMMLQWFYAEKGAGTKAFLRNFKPNVASVSPSWSFSYGLFKKQKAAMVFSYVTSLAFHWSVENDFKYKAVVFPEGHPLQVEYAAVPANCQECELAHKFVNFLLEPESQKILMEKNFMFPVKTGLIEGTVFDRLPKMKDAKVDFQPMDLSEFLEVFK